MPAPLIEDKPPADWRTEFFSEHHFKHKGIPRSEAVRTPQWKYIRYIDGEPLFEELDDLKNDPEELKNLAAPADRAQTLAQLRKKWETMRESVK